jgi:nitroreductase
LIQLLENRRSARDFEDRPIEAEKVELLKEAALRSPSSRSINPWEFVFVDSPETINALSRCREHSAAFLGRAPLNVVVLGDTEKADTVIEDCTIAAITLQYAAESLGLQSCWCQVRMRPHSDDRTAEEYIRELLGILDNCMVECVIGIGYPKSRKPGHDKAALDWGKVRVNKY